MKTSHQNYLLAKHFLLHLNLTVLSCHTIAGMTNQELKESVLKQPSLLQYSIASSLHPKVRFFLDELGILPDFIKMIIHSAPALVGLSLADNLRPNVRTITTLCSLNGEEVGTIEPEKH